MFGSFALLAAVGGFVFLPGWLRAREKQLAGNEAKANLSGLFSAEKAFFGEYMTYGTDLNGVNWRPDGTPLFVYGFCNEYPDPDVPGINEWKPERNHTAHPDVLGFPVDIGDPCTALAALELAKKFVVDGQRFTAFAVANLDDDPDLEVWSIDQVKFLTRLSAD